MSDDLITGHNRSNTSGAFDRGRRVFLKSLLAGSALVVLDQLGGRHLTDALVRAGKSATHSLPRYQPRHHPGQGFGQSVAAGDPTSSGAILWTRIDPELVPGIRAADYDPALVQWLDGASDSPQDAVRRAIDDGTFVMVEIATTRDFSQVALRGYTPIWRDYDNVVKVDTDGRLAPQKTYYYRFITKTGHVSPIGRFRTLASKESHLDSLRFAYVSCQDYTNGYYHALRFAAEEEVDFVIHLGDYIYESVGDPSYQNPLPDRQIRLPSGQPKAFTIEDYRTLYRTYKSDPDLRKLHERHAMISIWDDHEFANDAYYPAVAPDDSLKSHPDRRQIANRVWFEYTPARIQFDPGKSFKDSIRIYRSIQVGNLAEFIFTDERLYRSSHPCGEETLDRYFSAGCPRMYDPAQTMLGAGVSQQKEWFLHRIKNSDSLWKIWGNEVQFTPLKALTRYVNLDAWDGFAGERKEITQTLKDAGIKNFITITGDLHTFEANLIMEDYQKDPGDAAVGIEFMVGSVTSSNLSDMIYQAATNTALGAHSNPLPLEAIQEIIRRILGVTTPLTRSLVDFVVDKLNGIIQTENPWIKLFNSTTHGYCVMELTPYKATWTAYSVDDTKSRDAGDKSLLFQCEVPKDQARIRILNP